MALDLIVARLSRLDLFRGLAPEQLARLARDADRMVFRDGQAIIKTGEDGDGAVVIVSGLGQTRADAERGVEAEDVETGSILGEAAMLTEHQHQVTVVAVGDVRAVQITREALRAHMMDEPALADHFRLRLANRLQRVVVELRLIDEELASAGRPEIASATAA
ncbi:MAG: cyclic nucleotide-binding domain-containing protein [Hyphomicrobiaceae bacterium]